MACPFSSNVISFMKTLLSVYNDNMVSFNEASPCGVERPVSLSNLFMITSVSTTLIFNLFILVKGFPSVIYRKVLGRYVQVFVFLVLFHMFLLLVLVFLCYYQIF